MDCIAKDITLKKPGAEILMDYCAGTLDPAQTAAIEEHLLGCAECLEIVEAQRGLWQTLDAWKPISVSPDFDAKLYARIAQAQAEPWWQRMWQFPARFSLWGPALWKPALSVAAVGALATVLLVVRAPETKMVPSGDPAAQSQQPAAASGGQPIDIQEVQQALDDLDLLIPASSNAPSPL